MCGNNLKRKKSKREVRLYENGNKRKGREEINLCNNSKNSQRNFGSVEMVLVRWMKKGAEFGVAILGPTGSDDLNGRNVIVDCAAFAP